MAQWNPQAGTRTSPPGIDPAKALTLVLVRHGPTDMTVDGRLSGGGVPGPPLTEYGRGMAEAAAAVVEEIPEIWPGTLPVTEVLSSPLTRAIETAEIIAERLDLPVELRQDLREADFGVWEGLTVDEIERAEPGAFFDWHHGGLAAPKGGESYVHAAERISAEIDRIRDEGYARTVVVVGHTVMIRTILGRILGMPPDRMGRFVLAACSLSIVQYWPHAEEVLAVAYPTS